MDDIDPIDRVRAARCRISHAQGNDTHKLLAYYEALQERYRNRLVRATEPDGEAAAEASPAEGTSRCG
jgi:hypothetical protein